MFGLGVYGLRVQDVSAVCRFRFSWLANQMSCQLRREHVTCGALPNLSDSVKQRCPGPMARNPDFGTSDCETLARKLNLK